MLQERFGIPVVEGRRIWRELLDPSERGEISEDAVFEALAAAGGQCEPGAVRQALLDMVRQVPGAVSVLESLHAQGWRTAAASNHLQSWALEWRNRFPWFHLLDPVIISAEIGARKPSHEFFTHLTGRMGVTGAWFVDDRIENVEAAERFGFRGVWVAPDGSWHSCAGAFS